MAIIWPGQIYGALKQNGVHPITLLSPWTGTTDLQKGVFGNTAGMVWTQSDRNAKETPPIVLPKVRSLSDLYKTVGPAYRGEEGFLKEAKNRLVGTITLIPFEMGILTVISSFIALHTAGVFHYAFHNAPDLSNLEHTMRGHETPYSVPPMVEELKISPSLPSFSDSISPLNTPLLRK